MEPTPHTKRASNTMKRRPRKSVSAQSRFMQWRIAVILMYADYPFIIRQGDDGYLVGKTSGFREQFKHRATDLHRALIALKANGIVERFDWQGDFFTCKFNKPALFFPQVKGVELDEIIEMKGQSDK